MKKYLIIIVFTCAVYSAYSQDITDSYKIMFYNVENLFDTYNDSLINDEEFLPTGDRFWNNHKYYSKLNNIYKVIVAVGGWNPPAIIGLCEIENRTVLEDLISNTPLSRIGYKIVHYESPDRRGIDVALLYRPELFEVANQEIGCGQLGLKPRQVHQVLAVPAQNLLPIVLPPFAVGQAREKLHGP